MIQEIDFTATRQAAVERRNRALDRLDVWLEMFERNAQARGATVLFAETPAQASELVVKIAQQHDVKLVTKSKSMVSEEMALNAALERAGIESVETDLGEYILQINDNEAPSHIIAPVIHKDKEEISDLFSKVHERPRLTDIPQMTREAREVLRPKFLKSDMGVTGGNFLIAETGSVGIVTNEGNEGMCTVMPRVHVVVTGIEKILPTFEDFATIVRLLTRSATGQSISNYISLLTGYAQPASPTGPITCTSSWSMEAVLAFWAVNSRNAALYSVWGLYESLPGVSKDWRPCVWLGLSRADGLGAYAELCRSRKCLGSTSGSHHVRRVPCRLPCGHSIT